MYHTIAALLATVTDAGRTQPPRHSKPATNTTNTDGRHSAAGQLSPPHDRSIDWPDAGCESTDEYETIDARELDCIGAHTKQLDPVTNAANPCDITGAANPSPIVDVCSNKADLTDADAVGPNASPSNPVSCMRKTPQTLNLLYSNAMFLNVHAVETIALKKRRVAPKRSYQQMNAAGKYAERFAALNGIVEECEYDSDIGKFKCKTDQITSDNSSDSYDFIDGPAHASCSDDGDSTWNESSIVAKLTNADCIETRGKDQNDDFIEKREFIAILRPLESDAESVEKHVSTALCLATFFVAMFLLYFFPLSPKK